MQSSARIQPDATSYASTKPGYRTALHIPSRSSLAPNIVTPAQHAKKAPETRNGPDPPNEPDQPPERRSPRGPLLRTKIEAHLVVDTRQVSGMIFRPERVVPTSVIYIPKLVFRVVAMGVEPLHAAEGVDLALESTVLVHKVRGVSEPRGPDADVHHELLFFLFSFVALL